MRSHVYVGTFEDGIHGIATDGVAERSDAAVPFDWGVPASVRTFATAIRLLSREVPVPAIYGIAARFEDEVVTKLPAAGWRLTSSDIRRWMKGDDNTMIKENASAKPEQGDGPQEGLAEGP